MKRFVIVAVLVLAAGVWYFRADAPAFVQNALTWCSGLLDHLDTGVNKNADTDTSKE
jgi:hypothetical protein